MEKTVSKKPSPSGTSSMPTGRKWVRWPSASPTKWRTAWNCQKKRGEGSITSTKAAPAPAMRQP